MFHIHRFPKFTVSTACTLRKSHVNAVQDIHVKTAWIDYILRVKQIVKILKYAEHAVTTEPGGVTD